MPCGHANNPAPNAPSHSPFEATCRIGSTSPFGRQSFAPQRSAIHNVPFGATSTMLIEPSVRPSGAFIQPATVRYGFGNESLAHAPTRAASAAKAASRGVDMTAESARHERAVQGRASAPVDRRVSTQPLDDEIDEHPDFGRRVSPFAVNDMNRLRRRLVPFEHDRELALLDMSCHLIG